MDPRNVPSSPDVPFERALARAVLAEDRRFTLAALSDTGAILAAPDGSRAFVFRCPPLPNPAFAAHLRRVAGEVKTDLLVLAVIGGDSRVADMLREAQPAWMIRRRVAVMQLDEAGQLWIGPHTSPRDPLALALQTACPAEQLPLSQLHQRLLSVVPPAPAGAQELSAFGQRLRRNRPRIVWALAIVCGVLFALQEAWGGSGVVPVLVRMGANAPDRVSAGEGWRLLSCLFLHGSATHLLFNVLVLIYLGGFLERLLGPSRLLVLYALSGLAGNAASWGLSGALSLGASSALWGLLGASAALAFRPQGVLPAALVGPLKRSALINLGLNLMVSFLPRVDLWAHLGGGLCGAALVFSGVLTLGLKSNGPQAHGPRWLRPAGALAAVALVLAPAWALWTGHPWELRAAPEWQRVELGASGLSLEVPGLLAGRLRVEDGPNRTEFLFGEPDLDPAVIGVALVPLDPPLGTEAELDQARTELRAARLASPPPGTAREGEPRERHLGGRATLEEAFTTGGGLRLWRWSQVQPERVLTIDALIWRELQPGLEEGAQRLVESLRQAGSRPGP